MQLSRQAGFSGLITSVYIKDSTTGAGKTGLTASTVTCYYKRDTGTASVLCTLDVITALGTYQVYASNHGGFLEIDAVNMPGHYEFQVPNFAVGAAAGSVAFNFRATGAIPTPLLIELQAVNNQSSTSFVTSVPTVAGTVAANVVQVNGVAATPDNSLTLPSGIIQSGPTTTSISLVGTSLVANSGDYKARRLIYTVGTKATFITDPCATHSVVGTVHTFTFTNAQNDVGAAGDTMAVGGF